MWFILVPIALVIIYFLCPKQPIGMQVIPTNYLPDTFVVIDLETTGLNANSDEIIEVAAIRYRSGSTNHQTIQALIKPSKALPELITSITGITQQMLDADGEDLLDVIKDIIDFVGNDRIVTFNAEFDMAFLNIAISRLELKRLNNPISCALKMARRAWPNRKSFKLTELASDGGFFQRNSHRALEDARCALIVYAAAANQLKSVV